MGTLGRVGAKGSLSIISGSSCIRSIPCIHCMGMSKSKELGVMDQAPLRRGGIFPDTVVRCFIRITSKLTFMPIF